MKTNYLSVFTKKVAVIASLIGLSALTGIPVIAQTDPTTPTPEATPTPGDTTTPTPEATPTPTPPGDTTTPTPEATPTPTPPGDTTTPTPEATPTPPGDTTTPTPEATPTPTAAPGTTATGNVVEVAQGTGSFNTLAQAVQAAGLADKLSTGEYTVFAPTDTAFTTSLPPGAVEFLLQPENRELLREVLTYHVVPRELTASQLRTGSVKTLGGGVAVRVTPQRVIVNNASVVQPNIQASNGVIHAVNRVLLPRELRKDIASKLEEAQPTQTAPGTTTPEPQPTAPGVTTPGAEPTPTPGVTTPGAEPTPTPTPGVTTPEAEPTPTPGVTTPEPTPTPTPGVTTPEPTPTPTPGVTTPEAEPTPTPTP